MTHQLRYGESSNCELAFDDGVVIANHTLFTREVLADVAAATQAALLTPLHFPSITESVIPGDQVVVALDPDVPQPVEILTGVCQALKEASVPIDHITILLPRQVKKMKALVAEIEAATGCSEIVVHDPDDREQLAYLAASKDAEPILLNRLVCDADVVLPINLVRPEGALNYFGPHGGLVPTFSDTATQQRYRAPQSAAPGKRQQQRRTEADEVVWMLGVQLTLQIVAGAGDSVLHVIAGLDADMTRTGQELAAEVWDCHVAQRADLVIATIEGGPAQQTWENFGRALFAAQQFCCLEGTIILCTELATPPGRSLKRLAGFDDKERLLKKLRQDRTEDAMSAWLLLDASDRARVFLLSKLNMTQVEAIGLGYLESEDQIAHIAQQHASCILLTNAHRVAGSASDA